MLSFLLFALPWLCHVTRLLKDTMEKMADDIDIDEDDYNEYFLEQMLRSTVANLTVDIERGTLSR